MVGGFGGLGVEGLMVWGLLSDIKIWFWDTFDRHCCRRRPVTIDVLLLTTLDTLDHFRAL